MEHHEQVIQLELGLHISATQEQSTSCLLHSFVPSDHHICPSILSSRASQGFARVLPHSLAGKLRYAIHSVRMSSLGGHKPTVLAPRMQRQKEQEVEASLVYIRRCLEKPSSAG